MRVLDKVAIVTGGAGGLGAATARVLAREGAIVTITDLSETSLAPVAADFGGDYLKHDVTNESDWQRVVDLVIARHGRIDVLVHCAGIEGNREHAGIDTSLDEWNKVLAVNLTSTFLGCKTVGKAMITRGEGSIVLLSSVVGKMGAKTGVAYGTTKAGVIALARAFAAIGWQDGKKVRCNAVLPGAIRTGMTNRLFDDLAEKAGLTTEQIEAKMQEIAPLGSRGDPDDVANLILYLASDESKYVTGTEMIVDGGWTVIEEP